MSCPDCDALIIGYGAPDRSCERHWLEDHPGGQQMKVILRDVAEDLLKRMLGDAT